MPKIPKDKLKKLKKLKGPAALVAGYAGASIIPKAIGYNDKDGSGWGRSSAIASGAAGSAISSNPSVYPKFVRKAIFSRTGRKGYKALSKYAPIAGGIYGAGSGLVSYEGGRAIRRGKDKIDKAFDGKS